MPAKNPEITAATQTQLHELGTVLRERRKALGVSVIALTETAGLSRPTLYRIEKGEPAVTIGAYAAVAQALGLRLQTGLVNEAPDNSNQENLTLPARIRLIDYPVLQRLAWQIGSKETLSPSEALDIYERNARHLDQDEFGESEQLLLAALRLAFNDSHI